MKMGKGKKIILEDLEKEDKLEQVFLDSDESERRGPLKRSNLYSFSTEFPLMEEQGLHSLTDQERIPQKSERKEMEKQKHGNSFKFLYNLSHYIFLLKSWLYLLVDSSRARYSFPSSSILILRVRVEKLDKFNSICRNDDDDGQKSWVFHLISPVPVSSFYLLTVSSYFHPAWH